MKILYLAHRLPYPPNKGDKIRSFHQLEYLSRRHRLWCACFVDDAADVEHVDGLRRYCEAVAALSLNRTRATARGLWHLLRGGTLTEGYWDDRRMWATLARWSASVGFDAVVVFSSGMARYGLVCPAARRVIDFCDWDSAKWAAYASHSRGSKGRLLRLEARRLARREVQWIRSYDASVIITEAEADEVPDPALRPRLVIVGNGVDVGPYVPPPTEPRVGFVGAMDYHPNVDAVCWFADQVWPAVREQIPQASFQIVGRRPTAKVKALARRPWIEVTGEVPSVEAYLQRIAVKVAPLRIARGIQNKVLEAMAAGRPVVLTTAAAAGIDARAGRDYLVADDAPSAASAVVSLLRSPQRSAAIGRSARAFVGDRFSWDGEMSKLEALLTGPASPGCERPDSLLTVNPC
jgi:sugar transferase (PEP-CTERM/EpsH1 system associated)